MAYYRTVTVEVDVEPEHVIDELCYSDRKTLYEELKNEFDNGPDGDSPFFEAQTYTEEELAKDLLQIWESRTYLTQDQRARIKAITQEKFV